ncbi:MAG: oligoendopeptidase F [Planctomycetia bacterium 21-64-5]|nr:MAG: oligoendopeptidase F [Planctomycetia bacterium 21-64-5]HQU42031.1 oligoendopeptidase F [Pirellulales bacterium]
MPKIKSLPRRSQVKTPDTWDLSSLFTDDDAWEAAFTKWEKQLAGFARHRGKLGESPKALAACLKFDSDFDRAGERLGTYAFLKSAEDTSNSTYQRMLGRYRNAASRAGQEASFIRPEILAVPPAKIKKFLAAKELATYQLLLERLLRDRPHTLSDREEKLLAMQSEVSGTAGLVFRQLNNADLKFGFVENERGERVELSHASFSALLHSPDRGVRQRAFEQYYQQFSAHENTLAATLQGSIQRDVFHAHARNFASALEAALFPDNVPVTVYDNLIASVRKHLPSLYRYYELRRRKMKLRDIHHYDTYVPILSDLETRHTWNHACQTVIESLAPLGDDYCGVLKAGLVGRWCDRYENQGKQSGAFSSGSFDGDPYILMNYQPDVLDHVFTLAHEAGHSMHSYHSARHQPYHYYNYTIFVAEVASTFNEQLLSKHLMAEAKDDRQRAYLINREIDSIRATIVRQTMFAEFEKITHELVEQYEPLTVDRAKQMYRELLEAYFGPDFALDDELSLECFRIPHFYRAFYVYKYATGMSAAIALAERVTSGGKREVEQYLRFLQGGCSKDPLDLLRDAGVDMEQPGPVDTALGHFGNLVEELEQLL